MATNSSQSPPIDGSRSNFSTRDTEMSSPQSSTVTNGTPAAGSRYSVPLVGGGDRRNSTGESSPAAAAGGRRHVRSREGCLTCKRRKVKCDEQRPRCSHCERLNMECKWRPHQPRGLPSQRTHIQKQQQQPPPGFDMATPRSGQAMVSGAGGAVPTGVSPATETPTGAGYQSQQHAVDEVFDYASFMWGSGGELWQQVSPGTDQNVGLDTHIMGTDAQINFPQRVPFTPSSALPGVNGYGLQPNKPVLTAESEKLLDFFISSPIPPILAEVEAHKKWLAMRQVVTDMARVSRMVSCAILAFSEFLFRRRDETWRATENYYEDAVAEVVAYDGTTLVEHTLGREWLLAALFFLSYVDILENRMDAAHSHLKRAYTILQHGNKLGFMPVERQLLLWIRIVDGRAVSAGGEGLFLSKDDELLLVETSPASLDAEIDERAKQDGSDEDIKDVLFQVLYQPGIVFYQKVQSFMGRISMIDPWHRSRGTVEDETEVMNTAAVIATDLRTLYDQRPPLMDYAVAGKLSEPHISSHLAFAITRAFRTYLSNYYASKVHLHRVAYKTLPLTREAADALDHIRRLAKQIVADSEASPGNSGSGGGGGSGRGNDSDLADGDALPVTMLWPLLMLGVEEQDVAEKAWIKTQILRMEKVASNARITARVLEEVQARQDAAKARMDIRSIMHVVFNQCFAIT